jgi:hypothetical protein
MNGGYIDERRRVKKIALCKCNISHSAGTSRSHHLVGGWGDRRTEFVPILFGFSFPHQYCALSALVSFHRAV